MPGLVIVDKPAGWTSHDVVARMRRLAGTRKVGHAGTLDPMATGVLVVGVDRATRLLGHLSLSDKEYAATIRLGASTTTDDAEGEVRFGEDASHLRRADIDPVVAGFRGDIDQVPSSVSAVKIGGRRAYDAVRAGEDVELAPRAVHIAGFEITDIRHTGAFTDVDADVRCSTGTYVRALARDVGAALGVGGHLTALRRSRVGPFRLDQSRTLDQLAESFDVMGMASAARTAFPTVTLDDDTARMVRHGRALPDTDLPAEGPVALFDPAGEFLALYEQSGSAARALAVFT